MGICYERWWGKPDNACISAVRLFAFQPSRVKKVSPIYRSLLHSSVLISLLMSIDEEFAEAVRKQVCPHCKVGSLYYNNYPRKPRGLFVTDAQEWTLRYSLCCSRRDCRKRTTPPSARFLGRRVYIGVMITLVCGCSQRWTQQRLKRLQLQLGLEPKSLKTLNRWVRWWREEFPGTPLGRELQSLSKGPWSLIEAFGATVEGMGRLMRWLSPLSIRQTNSGGP